MQVKNKRHENRAVSIQFLYMFEVNKKTDLDAQMQDFFSTRSEQEEYYQFAKELVLGTVNHLEKIDLTIKKYAINWDLDRIAKVDLAILRLALFELLFREDIPPVVSINEAIELSKEFSSENSRRFINGILDKFKDNLDRPLRSAKK